MIRHTLARLTATSLAALALAACQDNATVVGPTLRNSGPRFSLNPYEQVDQQNLISNNWAGEGVSGFGQSFTAGKSGQLTSIDVQVTCGESMPDATLQVYSGSYNSGTAAPNFAAVIASQPVPSSVWPSCEADPRTQTTQTWLKFSFDTPASVVAGSAYTFRMIYPSGTIWHRVSAFNDLYLGGVEWAFVRDWDLIFKTYVVPPDQTAPVITPVISGTLGNNDWYTTYTSVSWNVVDDESAISSSTGCDLNTITTSTRGVTFTCTATSAGGTASQSVTLKVDLMSPLIDPVVSPNPITLNGTGTITPNAAASFVGLVSVVCRDLITTSIGRRNTFCTATDSAGNHAGSSALYTVVYPFTGFLAPVDAAPVLNVTKAGSAVPVKFNLGGDMGLDIMATDYPASQTMSCSSSAPTADLEETSTAGNSGLSYDAKSGVYTYVWKTEKSWSATCRKLTVKLVDGTEHVAYFKFAK